MKISYSSFLTLPGSQTFSLQGLPRRQKYFSHHRQSHRCTSLGESVLMLLKDLPANQSGEAFLGSRWTLSAMQQLPATFKTTAIMGKLIWIFLQRTASFLNYLHMLFSIPHAVMHLNCFALIYSSTHYGWDFKSHESLRWLSRSKPNLLVCAHLYRICKGRCSFILASSLCKLFFVIRCPSLSININ